MGTAAGPKSTMLIAGYFAKHLGKRLLMRIAVVAGFFFYAGMLLYSPAILLGLQLATERDLHRHPRQDYALFQDLMPGQAGSATTLYKYHSRGLDYCRIVGGSNAAEIWNYPRGILVALMMIVATVACLTRIKDV